MAVLSSLFITSLVIQGIQGESIIKILSSFCYYAMCLITVSSMHDVYCLRQHNSVLLKENSALIKELTEAAVLLSSKPKANAVVMPGPRFKEMPGNDFH